MHRPWYRLLLPALAAAALLLAGCGDDTGDGGDDGTRTQVDGSDSGDTGSGSGGVDGGATEGDGSDGEGDSP